MPSGGKRERAIQCKDCGLALGEHNYVFKSAGKFPLNRCRDCWNKFQSDYHKKRREESETFKDKLVGTSWRSLLKHKYGITEEKYWEMFNAQGGVCAVCKFPCTSGDKLCVDHNHETGKVRGLLCRSCNIALAAVNESEDLIYNLLDYIRKYNDCPMPGIRPTQDLEK